jgi:hypothetical protein
MSGEEIGRFTPFGLTSIDAANALVLRSIAEKDWQGMTDNLRILAYTPGDQELVDLAENHIKETENQMRMMRIQTQQGLTFADRLRTEPQVMLLKERNFALYKEVRLLMFKKGYLAWSRLVGSKDFEKFGDTEKPEGEGTET